jgi:hypothetical protein
LKIESIIQLQNTMKKISTLNFISTKKAYQAYKLCKTYEDSMKFILKEIEKIKSHIQGITYNKDGSFNIPVEKKEEYEKKLNRFFTEDFELVKELIELNMGDILEAGQAVEDKYKINAGDFKGLEEIFNEINQFKNRMAEKNI